MRRALLLVLLAGCSSPAWLSTPDGQRVHSSVNFARHQLKACGRDAGGCTEGDMRESAGWICANLAAVERDHGASDAGCP